MQDARSNNRDIGTVADIAETGGTHRAMAKETHAPAERHGQTARAGLTAISSVQWRALSECAIEPNGYLLPEWMCAVDASARNRTNVSTLTAKAAASDTLTGLLPVISLMRAYGLPLPALATADPYGTLCTPLLDRDCAADAFSQMMDQASHNGARILVLRDVALDGPAMASINDALAFTNAIREVPSVVPVQPSDAHWPLFATLCREAKARGNLATDAWLAALAIEQGCTLVTTDRDFSRFRGLRWEHPLGLF